MTAPKPDAAQDARPPYGLLISSHGGHLTELLQLRDALGGCRFAYYCYDAETTRSLNPVYLVPNRPYDPVQFARNLMRCWQLMRARRPDFLLSTGAEIALPPFLVGWVLGIPRIYIECGAQVTVPSMTGRVMQYLANEFWVQWPELLEAYGPRAKYMGSLIAPAEAG